MDKKRFLTSGEVFQLYGVDAESLERLVENGDVQALRDQDKFKYRIDEFENLVKAGRIKPRTSGDTIPGIDLSKISLQNTASNEFGLRSEELSFIELDEEALDLEAKSANRKPANTPEIDFDDDFFANLDSAATLPEMPAARAEDVDDIEVTEFDLKLNAGGPPAVGTDSDVRIVRDDATIDLDAPRSGSDSDVQLDGPVSSLRPAAKGNWMGSGSDSDVRLVSGGASNIDSDSDVSVIPDAQLADSRESSQQDSAVTLAHTASNRLDADSNIRLEGDSNVRLEPDSDLKHDPSPIPAPAASDDDDAIDIESTDSEIRLVTGEPEIELDAADSEQAVVESDSEFEIELDHDDDVSLEISAEDMAELAERPESSESLELEISESDAVAENGDSGIQLMHDDPDSGISLDDTSGGSDIALADDGVGSGITLASSDSGISLEGPESGLTLSKEDSGIKLDDHDSGIKLELNDSGISLDQPDSGITLQGIDSGIALHKPGSDITLMGANDSGIALNDADATAFDSDISKFAKALDDIDATDQMMSRDMSDRTEISDSMFGNDLSDDGQTLDLIAGDSDDFQDLAAGQLRSEKSNKPTGLSEAFQLDESLEVEDLDISEDLDSASDSSDTRRRPPSDEMDEALGSDDEFEASEEHFGTDASDLSDNFDDEIEESEATADVPVAKKPARSNEPSWGAMVILPVICASLLMAATTTVLLSGVATMWTGAELPGPASTLVSLLAGLSPL